nr:DUF1173 family protein [Ruegeria atlantica]
MIVESEAGQAKLARAHRTGVRVQCCCRSPHPEMYIAAVCGRFVVKRMPGTGPDHTPDCASFLPPEELSGLAQVQGTAVSENPEDGSTSLRLGFPLKKIRTSRPAPEATGKKPAEAAAPPRKLTITSLLNYLWHEAGLDRWYPAMEGKRWWGVVQHALIRAAAGKEAKGHNLSHILYVPDPFKPEHKARNAERRTALFRRLKPATAGRALPLGLVIAEYKGHEATPFGAKAFLKHMPDCAFFMDKDLARRFEAVFEDKLLTAQHIEGCHPIVIASFSVAKAGYPVLHEIGMMLVTANWLPFDHPRELDLLSALTGQRRAFIKSQRFNLDTNAPVASAVLTDTSEPVALFVAEDPDRTETVAALADVANGSRFPAWLWLDDPPMPPFPDRLDRTASMKGGGI